ncbi:MAG TPA: four helix bundle protein [Saprospiraceae bacterium]|nr:four helix bundle protein [Saprospiraceae bacterium]HNT20456.1 four helix bundle protein [Saprospiraceae bacterium]
MRNFYDLKVWKLSHELTLKIYGTVISFPPEELFGLRSQMRRSSSSIPTNLAEGCGRNSNPDFKRFVNIAIGSTSELEYQLLLAKDLKYLNEPTFIELTNNVIEIRRMLISLYKKAPL